MKWCKDKFGYTGLDVAVILIERAVLHCSFTSGCIVWSRVLRGKSTTFWATAKSALWYWWKTSACLRFISWFVTLHPLKQTQQQQLTIVGKTLQVNGTSVLIKSHLIGIENMPLFISSDWSTDVWGQGESLWFDSMTSCTTWARGVLWHKANSHVSTRAYFLGNKV